MQAYPAIFRALTCIALTSLIFISSLSLFVDSVYAKPNNACITNAANAKIILPSNKVSASATSSNSTYGTEFCSYYIVDISVSKPEPGYNFEQRFYLYNTLGSVPNVNYNQCLVYAENTAIYKKVNNQFQLIANLERRCKSAPSGYGVVDQADKFPTLNSPSSGIESYRVLSVARIKNIKQKITVTAERVQEIT